MFCDLVGSTALAQRLDPEELREVVRAFQAACGKVVSRFEGYVAQYLGDGVLVYFGYPVTHEDDAPRAVRTGLGIVNAVETLGHRLQPERGVELAVRVGIHTGLVVVGEVGGGTRHEQLALGETPNIAARLQDLAEPGTVVISVATHRLVRGSFECRDLGTRRIKGIATPVEVYRVLAESAAKGRLDAAAAGLTPLVGRDQEMGLLLDRWEQVKEGLGQIVMLSGEPGIGKSRLLRELAERVAAEPHRRLEGRCSPYSQHTPLYPVIDLLGRMPGWSRDDPAEEQSRKLEGALAGYSLSLPEVFPLLASLFSLPLPARYPPLALSPERQRQKTLEAVLALLLAIAAAHPLLLIVEDLHWVDPSTLEFLTLLFDQVPSTRVFALLAARPEFRPPWAPRSHLTHLMLNRFTRKQTELLVQRVAGGKALPAEVLRQVVTRTDGVPLFVEELTKMLLETGPLKEEGDRYALSGPLPPLAIPATLHDSLIARLDRLGSAKEVAQLAATLGRAFPYEPLRAVSPFDEATLQQSLERLVEAELIYRRGFPPQATYLFKHALIQEAAYQSLLKSTRQRYHQQIADVLAERFQEIADSQPELLAHHYTEAGLTGNAVVYWQRAGQRAVERSANVEAISHFTTALGLVKRAPPTPDRARQELKLQVALGPALVAIKGFAAPEVGQVYARARELCREVGETPQLFPVLRGLWEFYELRAEMRTARELAEQLLALARSAQDATLLLVAHHVLGEILLWVGEFALSRKHLEQAIAVYDPEQHRTQAFLYGGYDSGVACRSFLAHGLWYLGYPDQALRQSREALALAEQSAQPHSLVFALVHGAFLHHLRREAPAAQERAEAALALSTEQGFQFWSGYAKILRGRALVESGHGEEGIAQIHQGLAAYRATGAELELPYGAALLAEACGKIGKAEEGLTALVETLAQVEKNGVAFHAAELYRLRGELMLRQGVPDTQPVETCFHHALETARRQGARSLELQASTSLARLWQRQGKREEARCLLQDVYGWFTEGLDTLPLKEARALLGELA
jgi:class 3 adenylate cyclase/predicted ATPase